MNDTADNDPRLYAIPDIHGHAKGEHKAFNDERPIPLSPRMLFLWFYHACRRGWPRFLMVSDHMNYLTFEDPAAINLVRRALKLAQAGDLYGAAETASVEVGHAAVVSEGLRRGMRFSIGAEVDNDPRSRPDAQNIVDAMKPDGMIRSVHFLTIDHPTYGPNWNWPFDNPEFADVYEIVGTEKAWALYMSTLLDVVERLPGNILGHFYVPALFGHWPDDATLDGYENQLVDACEARGMAIELNTRFLYRDHSDEQRAKYLAAHRRLLVKCKAKNIGIAVGSDAHSPKDQGRAFETVLALLDECDINELIFPIAGRLARVALRVDRKLESVLEPPAPSTDERKAARKARPSETPARDDDAAPEPDDSAVPPKTKSRPKRGKAKTVETGAVLATGQTSPEFVPVAVVIELPSEHNGHTSVAFAIQPEEAPVTPDAEPAAVVVIAESVSSDAVVKTVIDVEPVVADAEQPRPAQEPAVIVDDSNPPLESEPETVFIGANVTHGNKVLEPHASLGWPDSEIKPDLPRKTRAKPGPAAAKGTVPKAKASPAKANPATKNAARSAAKTAAAKKAQPKKSLVSKARTKSASIKPPVKKAPAKKAAVVAAGAKKAAGKKSAAKRNSAKKPAQRRR